MITRVKADLSGFVMNRVPAAALRSVINGPEEPAHLSPETREDRMERTMEKSPYRRKCFILPVSLQTDPESSRTLRVNVRTGRSASAVKRAL